MGSCFSHQEMGVGRDYRIKKPGCLKCMKPIVRNGGIKCPVTLSDFKVKKVD